MSSVLFWRCVAFLERCLPLTIKLHSPAFTFPPFSPLSLSSSSRFAPPLNAISDFLTKECGFSSSQVTTVMRRNPQLLRTKSDHTAREVIHLLKNSGFIKNKVKSAILRSPFILFLKVDSQLKPKMEFLKKMGLAIEDIARIIFHRPRLLELSVANCLAPRTLHLETLFGSKVHLCKALRSAPQLLTSDFKKQVIPRVEYLKNSIDILQDSTAFVQAFGVVLGLSFETLEKKTKHMASLGLVEEEIGKIIKRYPRALCCSTKKMKENIDFLIDTTSLEPKIVALYPMLLGFSLEKRLKPHYEVFKSPRTSPHAKGLPTLAKFFILGEQKFLVKFSQYNTQVKPNDHTIS